MYFAYAQSYELTTSMAPIQDIEPLLVSSSTSTLNEAAKKYIIREQGTRRAEEPIRTLAELETEKHKLEKGYYLVSENLEKQIDVYELLIGEESYWSSAPRTLKPKKKISVCTFPVSNLLETSEDNACSVPSAPSISPEVYVVEHKKKKKMEEYKHTRVFSTKKEEPMFGLTPEILKDKIGGLRRVNSSTSSSSNSLLAALEPKESSEFDKLFHPKILQHIEMPVPFESIELEIIYKN
jgi:hypothetical protein